MKRITLAITGASGAQYGLRLLEVLLAAKVEVHFLISDAARQVMSLEMGVDLPSDDAELVEYFTEQCMGVSSGVHQLPLVLTRLTRW